MLMTVFITSFTQTNTIHTTATDRLLNQFLNESIFYFFFFFLRKKTLINIVWMLLFPFRFPFKKNEVHCVAKKERGKKIIKSFGISFRCELELSIEKKNFFFFFRKWQIAKTKITHNFKCLWTGKTISEFVYSHMNINKTFSYMYLSILFFFLSFCVSLFLSVPLFHLNFFSSFYSLYIFSCVFVHCTFCIPFRTVKDRQIFFFSSHRNCQTCVHTVYEFDILSNWFNWRLLYWRFIWHFVRLHKLIKTFKCILQEKNIFLSFLECNLFYKHSSEMKIASMF